jgi:hypothetical protein
MMAAFNVSQIDLSTYGYPEKISFNDPMSSLFRSKTYTGTDLSQVKDVLLPYFQNLDAYPNSYEIEKALDDYYKNPPSSKSSTPASTPSTTLQTRTTATTVKSTTVRTTTKSEDKPKTTTSAKSEDKPKIATPVTSSSCSQGKGKNTCK